MKTNPTDTVLCKIAENSQSYVQLSYYITGVPNSAKIRGGCRGPSKIRQRGVAIIFTFYALKIELFRVFTLSD